MDTSGIQREARALGDPTRHRLFHYIVDSKQPVGVAELTACVQLNHNAVRQHLAVLKEAELVIEEVEIRDRPGRPPRGPAARGGVFRHRRSRRCDGAGADPSGFPPVAERPRSSDGFPPRALSVRGGCRLVIKRDLSSTRV